MCRYFIKKQFWGTRLIKSEYLANGSWKQFLKYFLYTLKCENHQPIKRDDGNTRFYRTCSRTIQVQSGTGIM